MSCGRRWWGGGGHAVLKRVSPWSAGVRAFLLCFSESERFPCPDRSALNRETERVPVSESAAGGTGRLSRSSGGEAELSSTKTTNL